jgi:inosine-uridine nucleoside N-ribohydrolase
MGGSLGTGNTGPVAEFNCQLDPEAARCVFDAPLRELLMVPLGVTHTVLADDVVLAQIGAATPFRRLVRDLLLYFSDTYASVFGFRHGPPCHDPVAAAAAFAPHLFQTRRIRIDIECNSELSYGQTVADVWQTSGRPPNCVVAESVDVPAFWQLMMAALQNADERSPLNTIGPPPGAG